MTKPSFSEIIKIKEGEVYNLPLHQERMNRTCQHFFGKDIHLDLPHESIPSESQKGLVKCRIVYTDRIESIEFAPYTFKQIRRVAIVTDNDISYAYKSTDRSRIATLLKDSGADEIIIIKDGLVTDTSFTNIVCQDKLGLYTPTTCLLPGTKRAYLLHSGQIAERSISVDELLKMQNIFLINAMIDLEDCITIAPEMFIPNRSLEI